MTTLSKKPLGLIFILAAAFGLRMLLIVVFKTYAYPHAWEYEEIANNLLAGKGYSFQFLNTTHMSFATPLYGWLCAGVYAVTNHSYLAILVIQAAFSIALALTIFGIGKIIFSERVGLLAAGLVAFHPGLVYYDVFNLLPFSIDSFLVAAITLFMLKQKGRPTLKAMLLLGGLIGIAVLSRGITGVLLPLAIIYFALCARPLTVNRRLQITLCLAGGALLVLAPWTIRNYLVHNQFVFISSTVSENVWRGNNLYATGTSFDEQRISIFNRWPEDFKRRVHAMTEMQQKEFFAAESSTFVRNHPGRALNLYARKVFYFWWFSPQSGALYPTTFLTAYKFLYVILLSFFLAGAVFAMKSARTGVFESSLILLAVPITICLAQSVFFVEGRHRWLVEPIMIVFASYGVIEAGKRLVRRSSS